MSRPSNPIKRGDDQLLPDPQVAKRYQVSTRTILRWDADESLGFPKVIKIRDRNYRRLSELEAWERRRAGHRHEKQEPRGIVKRAVRGN
jgi:predicted DNA-binding transcriptional regulator AlpA